MTTCAEIAFAAYYNKAEVGEDDQNRRCRDAAVIGDRCGVVRDPRNFQAAKRSDTRSCLAFDGTKIDHGRAHLQQEVRLSAIVTLTVTPSVDWLEIRMEKSQPSLP